MAGELSSQWFGSQALLFLSFFLLSALYINELCGFCQVMFSFDLILSFFNKRNELAAVWRILRFVGDSKYVECHPVCC